MEDVPLSVLFAALIACLASSAFFSAAETAMMAINRYRLASKVKQGERAALRTQKLLNQTEKLLGVILLGNTIINTASATLAAIITARLFAGNEFALGIATLLAAFAILVFSEATPKVIAATHPEPVALLASGPLALLLRVFYPAVWLVNLCVAALLRLLRLRKPEGNQTALSPDELRLLVLESGRFMAKKHHTILLNLFELAQVTVDDVMTPRHQMEMVDLEMRADQLRQELFTSHHSRLPVYAGNPDNVQGILPVRKLISLSEDETDATAVRALMRQPYFIPSGTPLFTQLQNFQENHRRMGLVVDEYGELLGLVTLEDILEQMVGEFTTHSPASGGQFARQADGSLLLDGTMSLRDLNRKLKLGLPTDGPKTLNGLILEYFEDIPESGTCMVIAGQRLEVVQTQDRSIRMVRLYPR
ncbi:HlyC/CorC family transporter [Jeongeupia sp. USM3]|uniref:HlyC/CorC family transporter n=1 Tax=Jeongeupia sp. USM3 TaxID=1906741 RepID=UPI00089E0944|nr:HlyC/CorC family transporter [Jeongeupia sp. USM3]AOY01553.1 magnesium and cobalt efflux protein CorC [Jeongeupia sp. USM3]